MNIEHFARLVSLESEQELQKVALLAYFFEVDKDQTEFTVREMGEVMVALGFARPNVSRLAGKLRKSRDFIRGSRADRFRLSVSAKTALALRIPDLGGSEDIVSDSTLIPEILFDSLGRKYLMRTVQQINATYEANLFDSCALMMRRMLEILLIHTFQNVGLESDILDGDGNFVPLKTLINKAKSEPKIGLSGSVRRMIDEFRELGNLSAHLIYYSCQRDDIRSLRMDFRATVEELLYKAGLRGS